MTRKKLFDKLQLDSNNQQRQILNDKWQKGDCKHKRLTLNRIFPLTEITIVINLKLDLQRGGTVWLMKTSRIHEG